MKRLIQTSDGHLWDTDSYDTAKQHEDELFDEWVTNIVEGTENVTLKDVLSFACNQPETDEEFFGCELDMLRHILRDYWEGTQ